MATTPEPIRRKSVKGGARSVSRLGAVQALYQLELSTASAEAVAKEFLTHRLGCMVDDVDVAEPDADFFRDLVVGTAQNRDRLDERVGAALAKEWPLERLEAVVRAILRVGAYELSFRPDVPTKAIINEYVDVAHAFFDGAEPGFVNGVLDRLARDIRAYVRD